MLVGRRRRRLFPDADDVVAPADACDAVGVTAVPTGAGSNDTHKADHNDCTRDVSTERSCEVR